jgi:hypothetical protein
MRIIFSGQVPKDILYQESNEDCFEIDLSKGRLAVSDGASESFDSKTWARLLVSEFVRNPAINVDWLENVVLEYNKQYDLATLSWSKRASFDRGSFATLIGVEYFREKNTLDVITIGDSMCAFIEGGVLSKTFPYSLFEEFQQRPELLCTKRENNDFVQDNTFYTKHVTSLTVYPERETHLLLMTDALAEWALRQEAEGVPKWRELLDMRSQEDLQELVLIEREEKRMRIDDVTLVVLDPFGDDADELPKP